ncbi:MAG: XRE family transcriptional regulator [Rhodospirillaceae bacterium]|nr:MAG: XRE family transcriptional regulator [Rhodospirillaceae bacterium]
MIKTPKQLKIARDHVAKFEQTIAAAEAAGPTNDMSQRLHQAYIDGLKSTVESLSREIREFEHLASGDISCIRLKEWSDLPKALIQHRIAKGMSQADMARELNVKPQQVQRWEAMDNQTASFQVLCEMARILDLQMPGLAVTNTKIELVSITSESIIERTGNVIITGVNDRRVPLSRGTSSPWARNEVFA